jgi:hypothetical protein
MIKVPELSPQELEDRANALLADYEETNGEPVEGPIIPVGEIAMYHLSLRLDFADLHDVLRVPKHGDSPDILGAIFFDEDAILIDRSLDRSAILLRSGGTASAWGMKSVIGCFTVRLS